MNKQHKTPILLNTLLKWFCRKEYLDEVTGDLLEIYHWRVSEQGTFRANLRYILDVISAIRMLKVSENTDSVMSLSMLFSFIKTAFRSFRRHLSYTFLNILGLALGMAAALLILENVSDELNYSQSVGSENLYRVSNDYYRFNEMVYESSLTFSGVGPAMERDLPEVISYARMYNANIGSGSDMILTRPDHPQIKFKEQRLYFSDPNVVSYFDLEIVQGTNDLDGLNTILLTEEIAIKYFGTTENVIGKTLRYNDNLTTYDLRVAGLFKKPSFNLQIEPDILISYQTLAQSDPERFVNDWASNSFITFVKLSDQAHPQNLELAMNALTLKYKAAYAETDKNGEMTRVNRYSLMNIKDIHLNSKFQDEVGPMGNLNTIKLLQIIALFIVAIAWINFINLTTAKSNTRAREVGVRKVMGARKKELIFQFFMEAFLINLLALLVGLVLVIIVQPLFNQFVEKSLSLESIHFEHFILPGIGIFILGTLLSGVYPAMVLSSHKTVLALKGKSNGSSGLGLRRGLIVFQLLFSSLLIIVTLTFNRQLNYMNNQDLGFDLEQAIVVTGPAIRDATDEARLPAIRLFKERLVSIPTVTSIGTSTVIPGQSILRGIGISTERQNEDVLKSIERVAVDNGFLATLNVKFIAGKNFDNSTEGYPPIILNENACKELGFDSPETAIGKVIFEFGEEERVIIGVFKDYHHESLNRSIDAMYFVKNEASDTYYTIRLNTKDIDITLKRMDEIYAETFPGNPLDFYFLDEFFAKQYKRDRVNNKVFSAFALMAVIVACLGLYGLSSFSTIQRTKEIGVRKVLGAKVKSIFLLLSKEILVLSSVGFLLATPLAYYGINKWLDGFAYHIDLTLRLFVIPMLLVIAVTLFAVSYKIIQTALMNPVKSLRYE
jgi:putative ABC transport system permease protein